MVRVKARLGFLLSSRTDMLGDILSLEGVDHCLEENKMSWSTAITCIDSPYAQVHRLVGCHGESLIKLKGEFPVLTRSMFGHFGDEYMHPVERYFTSKLTQSYSNHLLVPAENSQKSLSPQYLFST